MIPKLYPGLADIDKGICPNEENQLADIAIKEYASTRKTSFQGKLTYKADFPSSLQFNFKPAPGRRLTYQVFDHTSHEKS